MSRLKKIIVLTQSQYDTLAQDGSISYNGGTLTGINDDYLYITTDQVSAEDLTGILPVAHGGTGLSSIANNQLLIGNENNALVPIVKADTIENTDNAIPSSGAVYDYAVPLAGGTMTGKLTLQSGVTTDSATAGALNLNNSNIYGVNAIYTADAADGASEGFHFYRDSSHSDTIWVSGGNIYFVPNRAYGTNTTAANSQKVLTSGNYTSYAWARPSTITADQVVLSSGTSGATQLRGVLNNTAKGALGWNTAGATNADNLRFATINTLAFWNGAYSGTSSNLSVLGTVTTGTWNATAIGAAYGGTGKTSLKDSANALINALDTGSSNLSANDYVITQYVRGGTTTTTYHRRPASAIRVGGLLTARKLKVALGSTADATFDGTADCTSIPVSGVLGIEHGGTGVSALEDVAANLDGDSNVISTTYLKLIGGTMVGTINRYYDSETEDTSPVLTVRSKNQDVDLFQIGHADAVDDAFSVSNFYKLSYHGSGSVPNNKLILSHDVNESDVKIAEVNQDGLIRIFFYNNNTNGKYLQIDGTNGFQIRESTNNTADELKLQSVGGKLSIGSTSTASAERDFYGLFNFHTNKGLNYSGIQANSTTTAAQGIWFSSGQTATTIGIPVYDSNFKYTPSTKTLTLGTISIASGASEASITASNIPFTIKNTGDNKALTLKSSATLTIGRGTGKSILIQQGTTTQAQFDTSGHFIPGTTNQYNIGSSTLKWANIYATNIYGTVDHATTTLDNTSVLHPVGVTSSATTALKYDSSIAMTGGQINAEKFRINDQARFEYNSTDDSIDLIWG